MVLYYAPAIPGMLKSEGVRLHISSAFLKLVLDPTISGEAGPMVKWWIEDQSLYNPNLLSVPE